ncbi:MAG: mechanosensitive ion channel, partial [Burkholderiales bacterium]|nr:mechanosensitive ion channel [Anaerolineae bacterium]
MFDQIPDSTREIIARILLALLALLVIWLLRRALKWLLVTPLRRLLPSRVGLLEGDIQAVVDMPMRYLLLALSITVVAAILHPDFETSLFLENLTRTLVIVAVFVLCFRLVDFLTPAKTTYLYAVGIRIEDQLLPFVRTALKIIILAMALVVIVQEWGYDVSGLVAGLGLGGLAFSLAAKDTLENLFGFTAIVGDRPFVVGESIKSGDVEGEVEHVGLRSTRVRQMDQELVTVPNSKLASTNVLNWSRLGKRHVNFTLRIAYDTRSGEVRNLLEQLRAILATHEAVEKDSIVVHFINFGENALEILVRC